MACIVEGGGVVAKPINIPYRAPLSVNASSAGGDAHKRQVPLPFSQVLAFDIGRAQLQFQCFLARLPPLLRSYELADGSPSARQVVRQSLGRGACAVLSVLRVSRCGDSQCTAVLYTSNAPTTGHTSRFGIQFFLRGSALTGTPGRALLCRYCCRSRCAN